MMDILIRNKYAFKVLPSIQCPLWQAQGQADGEAIFAQTRLSHVFKNPIYTL